MENGQSESVRNLPPGRLDNIRKQFESNSQDAQGRPALPTKTNRAPKIPIPKAEGAKSKSSAFATKVSNGAGKDGVSELPAPPIPPKHMDIPPIPPKENSTASKIQMFSPPRSVVPQGNRGPSPVLRKSPVGGIVLPKPGSPKPSAEENKGNNGRTCIPEKEAETLGGKGQSQDDISKMYAVVNKSKNGVTASDGTSSHVSARNTAKLFEGNQQDVNTPKKDKPPLMDKPKLTKKPVPGESEGSPKKTGVRQRSPKRRAPVPNRDTPSPRMLQTSQSLSGDFLCPEDKQPVSKEKDTRGITPPRPPQKPPRTHAHDKFLEARPGPANQKIPISPRRSSHASPNKELLDSHVAVRDGVRKHTVHSSIDVDKLPVTAMKSCEDWQKRPEKPKRPPPPRPKSSPSFSSVKGFSYLDDHPHGRRERRKSPVFDAHGKVQHPEMVKNVMYESSSDFLPLPVVKPSPILVTSPPGVHHNALHNEIKMGLLPRTLKSPPTADRGMFRSCSDECLYMEPSLSGDPVYMDPMETCRVTSLDDTYASHDVEVYIDADGYAVPHKFKKQGGPQSPRPGVKDKFRGLFRMFSDPGQESDTPRNQRKRLVAVKQKINQAFSLLQKICKKRESFGESAKVENPDRVSLDSDSFIDMSEILKRVEYVNSVKLKTYASIRNVRKFKEKIYPQLYECAVIVELERKQIDGVLTNQPKIKHKFPEMRLPVVQPHHNSVAEGLVNIAETIPLFCFPDAKHINLRLLQPKKSETYSFVLTDEAGNHVFGYCRRYTVVEDAKKKAEVICILSPVSAFQMYYQLLDEMEIRRKISLDNAQEIIASSFGRPLPNPGKSVHVRTMTEEGEIESIVIGRAFDNRLESVNYECLLSALGVDKLVKVFASILLERRLLFFASSLSVLSSTIQALVALLYPFCWHHTFIPVLPPSLLDIVCAPTPYIIGALSSEMSRIDSYPMEEALIIDLDSKCLFKVMGDESTILPKKVQKALRTALNLCRMESDKQSQNLMMSEAFIRLFVELVGHFGDYVTTQPDGRKTFQKEQFISGARSEGIGQLLQWFTETQMFDVFITDQLEKDHHKTAELFLTRIMECKESGNALPTIKSNVREFGRKVKNIGKAIKTKLT